MMFKNDENGITTDVKFVDFQMSYWVIATMKIFKLNFNENFKIF